MADDILTRLRHIHMEHGDISELAEDAADEIERLCAAGDALAEALGGAQRRHPCDCADRFDARTGAAAVTAWKEARRG